MLLIYDEIPLSRPVTIHGDPPQPPAAWILAGDQGIPASWGSYCYAYVCADYPDPQNNAEIVTARVVEGDSLTLIVQAPNAHEVQARKCPWRRHGTRLDVPCPTMPKHTNSPHFGVFAVQLSPVVDDQILELHARFPLGNAMYHWRLNPPA